MATFIKIDSDDFKVCNECGGFSTTSYAMVDDRQIICPECFRNKRHCTEAANAVIVQNDVFEEMVDEMRNGSRFSAWALYSREDTGKITCCNKIPFDHDNLNRPKFNPKKHILDTFKMTCSNKKWVVTAMSVPNIDTLSDDSLKSYARQAKADLIFLLDCRDRANYKCYRRDNLAEVATVVI